MVCGQEISPGSRPDGRPSRRLGWQRRDSAGPSRSRRRRGPGTTASAAAAAAGPQASVSSARPSAVRAVVGAGVAPGGRRRFSRSTGCVASAAGTAAGAPGVRRAPAAWKQGPPVGGPLGDALAESVRPGPDLRLAPRIRRSAFGAARHLSREQVADLAVPRAVQRAGVGRVLRGDGGVQGRVEDRVGVRGEGEPRLHPKRRPVHHSRPAPPGRADGPLRRTCRSRRGPGTPAVRRRYAGGPGRCSGRACSW